MNGKTGSAASNAPFLAARFAALALLAAASLAGVLIYLFLAPGASPAELRYYTLQSNLLVAGFSIAEIALLARSGRTGRSFERLRLAAVIAIMVTGIVFNLFLSGGARPRGFGAVSSFLCHVFVPAAAPVVWLLFAEKGALSVRQALLWLAYPWAYVVYALVQGSLTGFYPYWFLDPSRPRPQGIGSLGGVALFVAALSAAFVLLGSLMVALDRAMAGRAGRGAAEE